VNRNSSYVCTFCLFILGLLSGCSKGTNSYIGLTKENKGLPKGWVWAQGKTFSVALPETTKTVNEIQYPYPTRFANRTDFKASYWDETGKLIIYSVIICDLQRPIDSNRAAISTFTELDQGLTDSSPLIMLKEKNTTLDGKNGFEIWRRTQTSEENYKAFIDQSPNPEVRKQREESIPKFGNNPLGVKYHACLLLSDSKKLYLLVVNTIGACPDPVVQPFFDNFKLN
jgi:hypothetical protein